MKGSRAKRALSRALAVSCLVLGTVATPVIAAETPSAGGAALRQARAAWEKGSFKSAEPLYREALEKGGLAPNEVLEGYVRLGAIRSAQGKKQQAIAAFRAAAILDAGFAVPPEAGHRGPGLAAQARKDTAKIGSIKLRLDAPKEAEAGKPFKVTVKLDAAHVPIVAKIGLVATEGSNAKEATLESKADDSVDLDVPSDLAVANASILVRVDALDAHQNRLASVEERVKVGDAPAAAAPIVVAPVTPPPSSRANGFTPTSDYPPPAGDDRRRGGGFWSSPWPYVIGGIALAGAGAAVYFGTRPSQDVSVGQVGVRTR